MDSTKLSAIAAVIAAVSAMLALFLGQGLFRSDGWKSKKQKVAAIVFAIVFIVSIGLLLIWSGILPFNPKTETESSAKKTFSPGLHSYEFVQNNCTWQKAQAEAIARGGHLACFETREEYEYVLKRMKEAAPDLYYVRIGARRESNGTEYYWVDQDNQFYGSCINSSDSWCSSLWNKGDPTFTWKGTEEECCVISYDWDEKKWELNDIAYKVSPDLNQDMIGYIIEYEP